VAADGAAPFQGRVFFNADQGTVGSLQRRFFSGPWNFSWDMGASKTVKILERHSIQLRAEAFNVFNHPSFYVGNEGSNATRFTVNNATFGRITQLFGGISGAATRELQFGLYYRF
jgi:hypothetical protein